MVWLRSHKHAERRAQSQSETVSERTPAITTERGSSPPHTMHLDPSLSSFPLSPSSSRAPSLCSVCVRLVVVGRSSGGRRLGSCSPVVVHVCEARGRPNN